MTALDFCDTCGNKLLKDVKEQLGKLFSREEGLPDNACGICYTSLLPTVHQQVEKTEKVQPAKGVIKTEPPDSDDDTDDMEYDVSFEQGDAQELDKVVEPETDDSNGKSVINVDHIYAKCEDLKESVTPPKEEIETKAEMINTLTSSKGLCPFINTTEGTYEKGDKGREIVVSKIGGADGVPSRAHRELRALRREVFDLMGNSTDAEYPYQCAFCPVKPFKSAIVLVKHAKFHTSVSKDLIAKPFQCRKCGATFKKIREWMRHTGERPFKCTHPGCGKTFMYSSGLAEHAEGHGGKDEKKFVCKLCGEALSYKKSLDQHIKIKHKQVKNLVCRFCGWRFHHRSALNFHENTHSDEKPYKCDQCHKGFYAKSSLKSHMMHHKGEKPGEVSHMYVCEVCGFSTKWQAAFSNHKLAAHSKEYSHQCEQCGKRFKNMIGINAHRKNVHEKATPYKCRYCSEAFRCDGSRHRHEQKHPEWRGVRRNVCQVCGKDFFNATYLRDHMNTHNNVKPYACEVCDYRTSRQYSLTLHLKKHKGVKCFPCYYCDLRFVDYEECKDHRKICRPTRPKGRPGSSSSSNTLSVTATASTAPDTLLLSASASTSPDTLSLSAGALTAPDILSVTASASTAPDTLSLADSASTAPDSLSVTATASTAPSTLSVSAITSTVPPDTLSLSAIASTAPSTGLELPSEYFSMM